MIILKIMIAVTLTLLVLRCFPSHWSGVTALDGLCCHGTVLCLCGFVLPSTQMVMSYLMFCKGFILMWPLVLSQ